MIYILPSGPSCMGDFPPPHCTRLAEASGADTSSRPPGAWRRLSQPGWRVGDGLRAIWKWRNPMKKYVQGVPCWKIYSIYLYTYVYIYIIIYYIILYYIYNYIYIIIYIYILDRPRWVVDASKHSETMHLWRPRNGSHQRSQKWCGFDPPFNGFFI